MLKNKKITELNSYSKDKTLENIRSYKRKKTVSRRLTAIVIFGLTLIVFATIPILRNLQLADNFDREAIELADELKSVKKEKKDLDYEVRLLEDESYVAKLARKELNFSKDNEILINLPELEEEEETENLAKEKEKKE